MSERPFHWRTRVKSGVPETPGHSPETLASHVSDQNAHPLHVKKQDIVPTGEERTAFGRHSADPVAHAPFNIRRAELMRTKEDWSVARTTDFAQDQNNFLKALPTRHVVTAYVLNQILSDFIGPEDFAEIIRRLTVIEADLTYCVHRVDKTIAYGTGIDLIFVNAEGKVQVSDETVGSTTKFVYLKEGKLTATDLTLGTQTKPLYLSGGALTECAELAPKDSPAFTGTPTTTTPSDKNDNSKKIASTEWVQKWWSGSPSQHTHGIISNAGKININDIRYDDDPVSVKYLENAIASHGHGTISNAGAVMMNTEPGDSDPVNVKYVKDAITASEGSHTHGQIANNGAVTMKSAPADSDPVNVKWVTDKIASWWSNVCTNVATSVSKLWTFNAGISAASVTDTGVKSAAALCTDSEGKITAKTVDSAPTGSSTNLVTSGGVKTALDAKAQLSHTHGQIANDGSVSMKDKPVDADPVNVKYVNDLIAADIGSHKHGIISNAGKINTADIVHSNDPVNVEYLENGFAPLSHKHAIGDVTDLQKNLDLKAPIASPAFTGTPTAPTPNDSTNNTTIATTAWVRTRIASWWNDIKSAAVTFSSTLSAAGITDTSIPNKAVIGTNSSGKLEGKTVDSTPTVGSDGLVTSGGVASALADKAAATHDHGQIKSDGSVEMRDTPLDKDPVNVKYLENLRIPVNCCIINTDNTNPNSQVGYGTWVLIAEIGSVGFIWKRTA